MEEHVLIERNHIVRKKEGNSKEDDHGLLKDSVYSLVDNDGIGELEKVVKKEIHSILKILNRENYKEVEKDLENVYIIVKTGKIL